MLLPITCSTVYASVPCAQQTFHIFCFPNIWSYPSSLWLTDFVVYILLQKILISFSLQFGNLLSPEPKPNCQSEPQSPYLNMKSCSIRLTRLKGFQSVTQHLLSASNEFSTFNKPPYTLMAPSVATNPEAAYDCLGGHSKVDAIPVPSPKCKPPQKKLKYSGTSKPKKEVTVSYK